MPNTRLVSSSYQKLVANIVCLYDGVRRSLVEACWQTGRDIVRVEQKGELRAGHGERLLLRLSEDLTRRLGSGFSVPSLRRMRQFYLAHPKRSPASVLTWAHHIELLPLQDPKRRLALARRAQQDELDRDALRVLVRHERSQARAAENHVRAVHSPAGTPEPGPPRTAAGDVLPVPKLGTLNTYPLRDSGETAWPAKKILLLDHGFKCYRALTSRESRGLKAGDTAEWKGAKLLKTDRTAADLYTYKAYLERVIDGDTFWVMLDIGLRELSRQKLRLRGIDCPELSTPEGRAAKKFAEDLLRPLAYLIIRSSRNDKYDRYEADVFLPGLPEPCSESCRLENPGLGRLTYFNNLLLEKGFAVRML